MVALINPTSLILGLIAWILPIINMAKYNAIILYLYKFRIIRYSSTKNTAI